METEQHWQPLRRGTDAGFLHLPRRQRLWRRVANQRHDHSADACASAEHQCRRPEQSEKRRVSRLALGKRRLRVALAEAHRRLDLWRAKVGR